MAFIRTEKCQTNGLGEVKNESRGPFIPVFLLTLQAKHKCAPHGSASFRNPSLVDAVACTSIKRTKSMKPKKVLFITQEMTPYVPEGVVSTDGRQLPQQIQELGCEIRTFMPRWGVINERRNQLHEVIRLSGMNIIIDDTDHPLIIKVASIQAARMQVYFIDNDDYFHKRGIFADEQGTEYADNTERAVFYARGVLETVKKLRWCPDVIYCQGWMAAVAAFYIKTAYKEEPPFARAKVVTALYGDMPDATLAGRFVESLLFRDANQEAFEAAKVELAQKDSLGRLAVAFSDGIIEGEAGKQDELLAYAESRQIPVLKAPADEEKAAAYYDFFCRIAGEE